MNWKPNIIQRLVMLSGAIASFGGVVYSYTKLEAWNRIPKVTAYKHPYGVYVVLIVFGIILILLAFQRGEKKQAVEVRLVTIRVPTVLTVVSVLMMVGMFAAILFYAGRLEDQKEMAEFQAKKISLLDATCEATKGKAEFWKRNTFDLIGQIDKATTLSELGSIKKTALSWKEKVENY